MLNYWTISQRRNVIKKPHYEESGTIWIDLTDIINWKGNYTGIQRVELQLAERFFNYFPAGKVRYFKHNIVSYSFVEVDFNGFLHDQSIQRRSVLSVKQVGEKLSLKQLPPKLLIKKIAKSLLPIAVVKLLSVGKSVYSKNRNERIYLRTKRAVTAPFVEDDKVLILGGNWGSRYYMPALMLAKKRCKFKLYHVLHDLIPIVQPAFAPVGVGDAFIDYMDEVIQHADGLIANSQSTRRDVEILIEQRSQKRKLPVKTFRLGDDFATGEATPPEELRNVTSEFILCVGTFEVRKNYNLLYYVVKEARRQGVEIPMIVIAGKRGWLAENVLHLVDNDIDVQNRIVHLHKATDNELSWLYQNCKFTVFPSFYEGWGLPIAESLFYGKFCLASDTSSMPEIGGDLVTYFSPTNTGDCLDKIVHYTSHPDEIAYREQQIRKRYKPTSWDQSFEEFLAALYGE